MLLSDTRKLNDFWSNAKYYNQYKLYPIEFRLQNFTHLTPEDYTRWKNSLNKTISSCFEDKLSALSDLKWGQKR